MTNSRLDKTIAYGLLGSVAFTALAHGTVEPWSVSIFELIVLMLLLLWAVKGLINRRFELKIPLTAYPIAAFLVLGFIQSISLIDESGLISSLSFDPEATRWAVKILFFLLVSHFLAANFFDNEERIRSLVDFLITFGLVVAVFGIIQYFSWNGNLYWLRPAGPVSKGVIGPFVYHSNFAGYMELIIPLGIGLIITGAAGKKKVLYGFASAIMAIATIASLSRGGIISMFGGLLFIFAAGAFYIVRRNTLLNKTEKLDEDKTGSFWTLLSSFGAIALLVGAIFLGTAWVGLDPVVDRLSNNNIVSQDEKADSLEKSRGWIWRNSATMFLSNPVFGVGLGAFETAYPNYSDKWSATLVIDRAHNDYIQVLSDTGLIGGGIALWFLLALLFVAARALNSPDPFYGGIAIGIGGAVFSLMIHSVFDFNLQLPSHALLFMILVAVLTNLPSLETNRKTKHLIRNY